MTLMHLRTNECMLQLSLLGGSTVDRKDSDWADSFDSLCVAHHLSSGHSHPVSFRVCGEETSTRIPKRSDGDSYHETQKLKLELYQKDPVRKLPKAVMTVNTLPFKIQRMAPPPPCTFGNHPKVENVPESLLFFVHPCILCASFGDFRPGQQHRSEQAGNRSLSRKALRLIAGTGFECQDDCNLT